MGRYGSLKYQVIEHMKDISRIGESKHQAKQEEKARCKREGEAWNPSKVPGIFSYCTFQTYKSQCMRFIEYVKNNYPGINRMSKITPEHVNEYMRSLKDKNRSPWTIQTAAASISKVFDIRTTEELPKRNLDDISRSRGNREHDKHIDLSKYQKHIDFAEGCGCRREGLSKVRPQDIKERGNDVYVTLTEKGGKTRDAKVLDTHKERVLEIKREAEQQGKKKVFDRVPQRLDVHEHRRNYANNLYIEFLERYKGQYSNKKYRTKDGRTYNRDGCNYVSKNLGHNRAGIAPAHYLR